MSMSRAKKPMRAFPVIVGAILAFIYLYPKFLNALFGHSSPWTSFLYMYGFGLVTFAIGMFVIVRQGALKFNRGTESKWFHILILGFVFFSTLHGLWVILSLHVPHMSGVQ